MAIMIPVLQMGNWGPGRWHALSENMGTVSKLEGNWIQGRFQILYMSCISCCYISRNLISSVNKRKVFQLTAFYHRLWYPRLEVTLKVWGFYTRQPFICFKQNSIIAQPHGCPMGFPPVWRYLCFCVTVDFGDWLMIFKVLLIIH